MRGRLWYLEDGLDLRKGNDTAGHGELHVSPHRVPLRPRASDALGVLFTAQTQAQARRRAPVLTPFHLEEHCHPRGNSTYGCRADPSSGKTAVLKNEVKSLASPHKKACPTEPCAECSGQNPRPEAVKGIRVVGRARGVRGEPRKKEGTLTFKTPFVQTELQNRYDRDTGQNKRTDVEPRQERGSTGTSRTVL